jgi:signal peptidase II
MQRWIVFAIAVVCGLALDLGTKSAVFDRLPHPLSTDPIFSWFSLTHAENKGAAFGLFQGQHTFFMVVSIVAFTAVPYFVHSADRRARAVPIVLGLILAGVLGNFWDRIVQGHVRDFIDVHAPPGGALAGFLGPLLGTATWPTFNVADIYITCGAVIMVFLTGREAPAQPAPSPGDPTAPAAAAPDIRQEPATAAVAQVSSEAAPGG